MSGTDQYHEIDVAQLDYSDENLRRKLEVGGDGDVASLRASVAHAGIVEPLVVCPDGVDDDGARYRVVAGNRRLAAALQVGLEAVPCIVRELDENERNEVMLIENLQRADLAPTEEAVGYGRLAEAGWTAGDLAERIGRSEKHVRSRLRLLELPERARAMVDSGELTLEAAGELTRLYETDEVSDEQIDEALEVMRDSAWAPERIVERTVAAAKFESALAKAVEKLDGQPIEYEVLRGEEDRQRVLREAGWRVVVGPDDRPPYMEGLHVNIDDVAGHDEMTCSRLLLLADRPGKPETRRACADPKAHTTKRAEREGGLPSADYHDRREERERKRAEREAERERVEGERRRLATAVAGARKQESVSIVASSLLASASDQEAAEVCRVLGLEPVTVEEATMDGGRRERKDWTATLRGRLEGRDPSSVGFLRVALALALVRRDWSPLVDADEVKRGLLEQFADPGSGAGSG